MTFLIRYYIESNKFFSQIIVTERNVINMINMIRITENPLLLGSDEPVPESDKSKFGQKSIFVIFEGHIWLKMRFFIKICNGVLSGQ